MDHSKSATPSPSQSPQLLSVKLHEASYKWILTEEERTHIGSMLNVDPCVITRDSNVMTRDRGTCKSCGKSTGLDDLVHNALAVGVHTPAFILEVLQQGPKFKSPGHEISCSKCGEMFEGSWNWDWDERGQWW